jgi:hypothetical protein
MCRREFNCNQNPSIEGLETAQWSTYVAAIASTLKRAPAAIGIHTNHARVLALPQRQAA